MQLYAYRNDPNPQPIEMESVLETGTDAYPSEVLGEDGVWYQPATLAGGRKVLVVYQFAADEMGDELDDFPWDGEHQVRVQLAE
jgi:hypothetical protein